MRLSLAALFLVASAAALPLAHNDAASSCKTCDFVVGMLHNLWGDKIVDECIGDFFTFVCKTLKIEDHFICRGMVGDFKEEFIYVAGKLVVNPKQICGLFIKDCGNFFDPLNATWHLPMPGQKPPHYERQPVQPGNPTLRVLHLTDVHLDMQYTIGEEATCSEPQCCRKPNDPNEITRRSASQVKTPAGKWGYVGNCDVTYWTVLNMMEQIKTQHTDLDYVVVSGDLMSHADWDYTHESHARMVRNISDTIRSYLPHIPVYFAVGNHEGVPIDNFAPDWAPARFNMSWLFDAMGDSWKGWVPQDQDKIVRYNGCYMAKLCPGLRIISLNNAWGDAVNFYLYLNQTDPDGSMTWFINQLYDAEQAGDKVHVVAHIPGGSSEALEGWAINYAQAINRFEDTVVEQFMGHTHTEQFYMNYIDVDDYQSRPTGVIYSAPSITTYSENNPAYRIYTIDGNYKGSTYQVMDFEEYFFNVSYWNAQPEGTVPQWQLLYKSAKEEYGLSSLLPTEWNNLVERFKTDDALFAKYMRNYYRMDGKECEGSCRTGQICSMRQAHHNQAALCSDLEGAAPTSRLQTWAVPSSPLPSLSDLESSIHSKWLQSDQDKCPL